MTTQYACPPASRLARDLNLAKDTARRLRALIKHKLDPTQFDSVRSWLKACHHEPARIEQILFAANELLDGYGVEVIRSTKTCDRFWQDTRFAFINLGDVYTPTLFFNTASHAFSIACMADIADRLASVGELTM